MKNYCLIKQIGEGGFSQIFQGRDILSQKIYAFKVFKKAFTSLTEINNLPEVCSLKALMEHPNIIQLHDVLFERNKGILVLEYINKNLFEFSKENQMNEEMVLLLIYQLLKGIQYTHECNYFHSDLKPENCLVNSETFELKLSDFGNAFVKKSICFKMEISPLYGIEHLNA
jgi:renal tumor antigen